MASLAGAIAAMRAHFVTGWTTPIAYPNGERPAGIWPPQVDGKPVPWAYFEVLPSDSDYRGVGLPGDHVWLTRGNIFINIYCAQGAGVSPALELAEAAGEKFRAQTLYRDEAGAKVVCRAPICDGGGPDAENGNVFRVTTTIPFEFFFRK